MEHIGKIESIDARNLRIRVGGKSFRLDTHLFNNVTKHFGVGQNVLVEYIEPDKAKAFVSQELYK